MKVSLGFSYFNCVKEIPRALDPIYKHFDKIYAIDGRYINYEDSRDYSEDGSTELLQKYPNTVIEKCKPMFQTDKRQRYLDLAGEDKMDFLIVWDSDDIIHPDYQNWDLFFKNIQRYSKKFPDYYIFKMKSWIPASWPKAHNALVNDAWTPYIRIHKNPGGQRYCLYTHYYWCPKDASDEDLIMQRRGMYISDHTIDGVRITTDAALRGEVQLQKRDNWAWNNIWEEKRRQYILQKSLIAMEETKDSEWIGTKLDGYYRYDRFGKPTTKICEEDGTPVSGLVPYIKR